MGQGALIGAWAFIGAGGVYWGRRHLLGQGVFIGENGVRERGDVISEYSQNAGGEVV